MKLRLRENSIRLRLLQSEIKKLQENGIVSEKIQFANSQILTYTLKISNDAKEISAVFAGAEITVEIPFEAARKWIQTTLVRLEYEQKIENNLTLRILLEKDFVCLERPLDADNADAFPHPKIEC